MQVRFLPGALTHLMTKNRTKSKIERTTEWMGSIPSLVVHTIAFIAAFAVGVFDFAPWDMVLLVLTTAVSLEAIYLALFIQMTVNRQGQELQEVSEDVEDIQEDIEDISEDVEEIQKDVEEISEDVEDIQEDVEDISEEEPSQQAATLESLARDMQRILLEIESLKKK